jgi:hypothetical protein
MKNGHHHIYQKILMDRNRPMPGNYPLLPKAPENRQVQNQEALFAIICLPCQNQTGNMSA